MNTQFTKQQRSNILRQARSILAQPKISQRDRQMFEILTGQAGLIAGQAEAAEARGAKPENNTTEYRQAFRSYIRHGWMPTQTGLGISEEMRAVLTRGEYRDMGSGGGNALQGSGGGFFVPVEFEGLVETAIKDYGPMLEVSTGIDTARGGPLAYPTSNDTATVAEQVTEGAEVTVSDPPLSSVVFGAYKFSSKMIKMSVELLQDTGIDIEALLADQFGQRFGRCLNPLFTNGTGSGQPKGILYGAPVGATATGSSANTGGAETGGTTIGSDDLIALEESLDPAYRRGASYMMHDNTLLSIKKLKDKQGHPLKLWRPESIGGSRGNIGGYGVFPNPNMAPLAVNAITVAFGRLDKYVVRRAGVMHIQRISERYADQGQVAFVGWIRRDGALVDAGTHPIRTLQMAAS